MTEQRLLVRATDSAFNAAKILKAAQNKSYSAEYKGDINHAIDLLRNALTDLESVRGGAQ